MTDEITIDHCPGSVDGKHRLDHGNRCDLCDTLFTADETWEGP